MRAEIIMPAMEMAQDTAKLLQWLKHEGDHVTRGEPLMLIETDKVSVEIEANATGYLSGLTAQEDTDIPVGSVMGFIVDEMPAPVAIAAPTPATERVIETVAPAAMPLTAPTPTSPSVNVTLLTPRLSPASPKARRLAKEYGINLQDVVGSGANGEVLAADVRPKAPQAVAIPTVAVAVAPAAPTDYTVLPLTGIRKVIAERVTRSYQTIPHFTLTASVNMRESKRLLDVKKFAQADGSQQPLTLTALLIKVVALALQEHPRLNAHCLENEIRLYPSAHIGVAVALQEGLIIPVLRDAQSKGLANIQQELHTMAAQARAGTLKHDQLGGGTFTISNLGMFGIEQFDSILNAPEVGILSVGAIQDVPANQNNQIVLQPTMKLTLAVDHRVVDGAVAAAFLQTIKQTFENPYRMLT